MVTKNRKTRGEGVAIIFDKNLINLAKVKLGSNDFELVAAVGRTVSDSRKILVISVYYPPQMRKEKVDCLNSYITDLIDRQNEIHEELQVFICGDINGKDITPIMADHPEICVLLTPSTRGPETLDLCLTNMHAESEVR